VALFSKDDVKLKDGEGDGDPKPPELKPSCVVINIYCGDCCDKKDK